MIDERSTSLTRALPGTREPLLTAADIEAELRISRATVNRLVRRGSLSAVRVGGRLRFTAADVDRFLERQREGA